MTDSDTEPVKDEAASPSPERAPSQNGKETNEEANDAVVGSAAIRPIFFGNLMPNYTTDDIVAIFENPSSLTSLNRTFREFPVDHVDLKRGFCFVFLKDAETESYKKDAEAFIEAINGISIPNVSRAVRVEFARGDGRVKRKEDERRQSIAPCDTLFVVNFSEGNTNEQDLRMLFEPYGELQRIDMRKNYAFVQFRTIEQATKAKEATNGGKLENNIITVEFVASRQRDERRGPPPSRRPLPPPRNYDRRYDDRGRYPPDRRYDNRYDDRGSYEDRGGRYRGRSRSRSPPRRGRYDDYDDYPPRRGSPPRRGASPPRSRRSLPRGRGHSPPRRGPSPPRGRDTSPPHGRGVSPPRRAPSPPERYYRGGDRDRGYRG